MSTISVRLTLLTLATVMFAVVWSNDHKPEATRMRTVVAYDFPRICPVDVIEPVSHEVMGEWAAFSSVTVADPRGKDPIVEFAAADLQPLTAAKPVAITVSDLAFPLPSDLTAGEYRVVDRFGNVETLSVSQTDLFAWGMGMQNLARNAYEVCAGTDRWHFIRIEQEVAPAPTQQEVAEVWKSVFRVADRRISPTLRKASAPIARWWGGETDVTGETREIR